ncbi:hypothetical protein O3M35_003296 [Rhynocoris fuscipes]|uniref:Deltamethrin resistance protein prag01 domain-containing protein n=1 Tax=Rhynocoris fuscipes TaxID=488301 RepID=A0AAW1CIH1_9HEMI
MFSRIINSAVRSLRLNNRSVVASTKRLASTKDFPPTVTMDDLPTPIEDWETCYEADQAKNNIFLAGSIGFFIFTLIAAKFSGLVDLAYYPPDKPADPESTQ